MGTMARTAVIAGTATAVSGGVRRHAEQKQASAAPPPQPAAAPPPPQPAAAPPPPSPASETAMSTDDKISKIKQLGELKDQGLLTEEEFAAEKAKVLAA
ncbi:hypothetical protein GCM10009657_10340 [Oryzihumus leptocrescens]